LPPGNAGAEPALDRNCQKRTNAAYTYGSTA